MSTDTVLPTEAVQSARRLDTHLESYLDHLRSVEYSESSLRKKRPVITAFARWARSNEITEAVLSERHIEVFVTCSFPGQTNPARYARSALRLWLNYLRAEGWVAPPVVAANAGSQSRADELLRRYAHHLRTDCGLAEKSLLVYLPFVRDFLAEQATQIEADAPDALDAPTIRRFLLKHARNRSSEYCRLLAISLRSLCRFLFLHGDAQLDLSRGVPSVRRWRQAGIPVFLTPAEVERILATPNRSSSRGRRDYAILLLLARLGLRASEIVGLELDDLHWRTGEMILHGKGRIRQRLPLLADVGEAIATYLRQDRGSCTSRRVFLREKAPCGGLTGPASIGHVVRLAFARAGIKPASRGAAHLMRHSLATRMVRHGASLSQIAEVLRHRSENSSAIYAKVSCEALRGVARPWPVAGDAR
ncbi:tyrosine-type recombinase/integrase [Thauera humireducens]|uniref:tyrosine-type recombinase/integrase n=1 Tax=Thauera humireducens TaxID=1134435 RepID=UPI0024A7D57C|nr:tyrosine-type recombinase/integrase [Thauera humireducens]